MKVYFKSINAIRIWWLRIFLNMFRKSDVTKLRKYGKSKFKIFSMDKDVESLRQNALEMEIEASSIDIIDTREKYVVAKHM